MFELVKFIFAGVSPGGEDGTAKRWLQNKESLERVAPYGKD